MKQIVDRQDKDETREAVFVRDAFDMLYEEGARGRPKMMSIGLHMRLIGHPARAAGLARLLRALLPRGARVAARLIIKIYCIRVKS